MPKKILLPLCMDDSDSAVLDSAKALAKNSKPEITLMFVTPDEINSSHEDYFNQIAKDLQEEGFKVDKPVLIKGDEVDETLRVLKERNIDLVVMLVVNEGEEGVGRKTNLKLIRKSEIPVWEVKPGSSDKIKRILCPVDFSEQSGRALKNAIYMAGFFSAELQVLSVYEPMATASVFIKEGDEDVLKEHKKFQDSFLQKFDFHNVKWDVKIRSGEPSDEIIAATKELNADLLIMGSAGRSGIQRKVIGSTTETIIKSTPCSLIAIREKDIF